MGEPALGGEFPVAAVAEVFTDTRDGAFSSGGERGAGRDDVLVLILPSYVGDKELCGVTRT